MPNEFSLLYKGSRSFPLGNNLRQQPDIFPSLSVWKVRKKERSVGFTPMKLCFILQSLDTLCCGRDKPLVSCQKSSFCQHQELSMMITHGNEMNPLCIVAMNPWTQDDCIFHSLLVRFQWLLSAHSLNKNARWKESLVWSDQTVQNFYDYSSKQRACCVQNALPYMHIFPVDLYLDL